MESTALPQMRLRLATLEDAGAIQALYAPYVLFHTASWEYEPPTVEEMRRRITAVQDAGFAWLVAQCGETLLGYAYAGRYGARRGYDFTTEVSIYMAQEAQGKGVGRRLYTALLSLLCAQGYCNAMAIITHPNPVSEAFHTAMGFVCESCMDSIGYKQETWLGLAYYRRVLNPCCVPPAPTQTLAQLPTGVLQSFLCG